MIVVPIDRTTIPFSVKAEHGAGKVLLKPASKGSGVIAGGPVRAVVEAAGIKDVSAKILGSDNQASSVHATFNALKQISRIVKIKGIKIEQDKPIQEQVEDQKVLTEVKPSEKTSQTKTVSEKKKINVTKKVVKKKPATKKEAK